MEKALCTVLQPRQGKVNSARVPPSGQLSMANLAPMEDRHLLDEIQTKAGTLSSCIRPLQREKLVEDFGLSPSTSAQKEHTVTGNN
jgi:hypothetical protein